MLRRSSWARVFQLQRRAFSKAAWDSSSPPNIKWGAPAANWREGSNAPALSEIVEEAAKAGYNALSLKGTDDFAAFANASLVDCPVSLDLSQKLVEGDLQKFDSACRIVRAKADCSQPHHLPFVTIQEDFVNPRVNVEQLCANIEELKARGTKLGAQVLYHPSCEQDLERVLSNTTASIVFDTASLEGDLVQRASKIRDRIGAFVFKDVDPALATWMEQNNFKGFAVVNSSPVAGKSPTETALANRRAISEATDAPLDTVMIGTGRMGLIHFRNALKNPRFNVKYLIDANEEVGQRYAKEFGVEYVKDVAAIADKVECALIATPSFTHVDYIKECASHGIDMMCEKPLAETIEKIDECYKICDDANVILLPGFQRRFDPIWTQFIKEIKAAGAPIECLRLINGDHPCPPAAFLETSGGIFKDLTLHDFDQLQWVMQEPVSQVHAMFTNFTPGSKAHMEDSCMIALKFNSGAMASIHATRRSKTYDQRMEVLTENGTMLAGYDPNDPIVVAENNSCLERWRESYYHLLDHFADIKKFGVPHAITKAEVVANSLLAELCEKSVETGLPVDFPPEHQPSFGKTGKEQKAYQ